jgi:hypothetical protein
VATSCTDVVNTAAVVAGDKVAINCAVGIGAPFASNTITSLQMD